MASPCPLLGAGVTDDTLLHIFRFLADPEDLLRLQLTCPRFAAKVMKTPVGAAGGCDGPGGAAEMLSIPTEAARLWVAACSEQERGWVPRWGRLMSWLSVMHEVGLLRLPLAFGDAHASITLSEDGALATRERTNPDDFFYRSAQSKPVMRSGRHFAQLTLVAGDFAIFGVQEPGSFDVEGETDADPAERGAAPNGADAEDCHRRCFYHSADGGRLLVPFGGWPTRHWEGRQSATAVGDRIGMLLDIDQGSLSVWKNGEPLGVMQDWGLTGRFCWSVAVYHQSVRIESAPVPVTTSED